MSFLNLIAIPILVERDPRIAAICCAIALGRVTLRPRRATIGARVDVRIRLEAIIVQPELRRCQDSIGISRIDSNGSFVVKCVGIGVDDDR